MSINPATPDYTFVSLHHYRNVSGGYYLEGFSLGYKFFRDEPTSVLLVGALSGTAKVTDFVYGFGGFSVGRSVRQGGTATTPGEIEVATLLSLATDAASSAYPEPQFGVYLFPSPQLTIAANAGDPGDYDDSVLTDVVKAAGDPVPAGFLTTHQGRFLYLGGWNLATTTPTLTRMGSGTSVIGGERVSYSKVNDWLNTAAFAANVYMTESPFAVGAIASMNASEVVVIKRQGGGFSLRGDMDNPTVVRLPGLVSTGIAPNVPTVTPLGLVYGSVRGVFLWAGGDVAECISPQLDGWFWKPGSVADQMPGEVGSFACQFPYVFAPANWLYDTRLKSWWRLGKPTVRTYAWNAPSANGRVLCAPAEITATQSVLVDWYDPSQGTSKYHARTHPLQRTRGRLCHFRRIRLVMEGRGLITITLRGIDGATQAETFRNTSLTERKAFSTTTKLDARDVVVDIDARAEDANAAYDSTGEAPTLVRVGFGFNEGATLA